LENPADQIMPDPKLLMIRAWPQVRYKYALVLFYFGLIFIH